jgi:hypothetical protein
MVSITVVNPLFFENYSPSLSNNKKRSHTMCIGNELEHFKDEGGKGNRIEIHIELEKNDTYGYALFFEDKTLVEESTLCESESNSLLEYVEMEYIKNKIIWKGKISICSANVMNKRFRLGFFLYAKSKKKNSTSKMFVDYYKTEKPNVFFSEPIRIRSKRKRHIKEYSKNICQKISKDAKLMTFIRLQLQKEMALQRIFIQHELEKIQNTLRTEIKVQLNAIALQSPVIHPLPDLMCHENLSQPTDIFKWYE